ncbi:MAG: glycosyltransferase, partial [Candidatus Kapabacteria bacterium]|nr:glycosyltransferase [Candidatus Kapabacteria bacterium]
RVSVIGPARNEERNIAHCLDSILALDYPTDSLELIVVDDRSSDATNSIVKRYARKHSHIVLHTINSDGEKNLQGKPGALDAGISIATGEILLMTDADCRVHPRWVRSHVNEYVHHNADMVCAYTLIDGGTLFSKMQAVEWNSTHTMASAGVYYKQYLGCFGNNLSISRTCYDALGGYSSIPFSITEDLALMQEAGRHHCAIRYICSQESSVTTQPILTLKEYLTQHKRWVHGGQQLGWRATVFVLTSAILWIGLGATLYTESYAMFLAIALTRLIGDGLINIPALFVLRRKELIPYIAPAILFFTLLELILPFLLIDRTIVWKGQEFKQ